MVVRDMATALAIISHARDCFAGRTATGETIQHLEAAANFFKQQAITETCLPSGRICLVRAPRFDQVNRLLRAAIREFAKGDRRAASARLQEAESVAGNEADVRILTPRDILKVSSSRVDRRIPPPGTLLSREFRGQTISVKVLAHGFEYLGRDYRSLSAIAAEVTGTRQNGLAFFGLAGKRRTGGAPDGSTRR